jgi:hypothetical protein
VVEEKVLEQRVVAPMERAIRKSGIVETARRDSTMWRKLMARALREAHGDWSHFPPPGA